MKLSKKFLIGVGASMLLLWAVAASAQDVRYNFVPGTDFAKYRTYKWVKIQNVQYPDQILDGQIMQAIDSQLALKGLAKTESETADLYVCYQAAVNQETQWNSYSTDMGGWGYGRWGGWGAYGGGMGRTTTTSSTINIGTLNVDIYEVGTRNQIWRGAATKTLGSGKDPNKVNKNLNKAMAKLFKNYPPRLKK